MYLQEQQHQKELAYLGEKHEREAEGLKAEVHKYQYQIKKQFKEDGVISMLKK